ncbi:hypothetical protein [Blastococcus montanus]
MSKLTKGAAAKKVMNEAKKPQNQQKIKGALSKFTGKGKSTGGTKRT